MIVVDALINNHDRNLGNWGIILNKDTDVLRSAPVYDNGGAFYSKNDDEKLKRILEDEFKFKQVAYDSSVSVFKVNGDIVNPLKYIESMSNSQLNAAILRILPRINLEKIRAIFDEIPEKEGNLVVMSEAQRKLYFKVIEYRYKEELEPIYKKLCN